TSAAKSREDICSSCTARCKRGESVCAERMSARSSIGMGPPCSCVVGHASCVVQVVLARAVPALFPRSGRLAAHAAVKSADQAPKLPQSLLRRHGLWRRGLSHSVRGFFLLPARAPLGQFLFDGQAIVL